jgi:hypothetical protein
MRKFRTFWHTFHTFPLKSACACCAIKNGFNSRRGAPVLRGYTYREIAGILAEKCSLVVDSSTLVRFMAARSKQKRKGPKRYEAMRTGSPVPPNIGMSISPNVSEGDLLKRIEAFKQRPANNEQPSKQFEYDPDQPLQLRHKE